MICPSTFALKVDIYSCYLTASSGKTDCLELKLGNDFQIAELSWAAFDMMAFFQNH